MMKRDNFRGVVLVGVVASAFILTSCAGGAGADSAAQESESVPYGASKEEWAEAFAEIEPITLTAQSPYTEDAPEGYDWHLYLEEVSEWSDGKINFDIAYSSSIVTDFREIPDALGDGRLDIAQPVPQYFPQEFSASNELSEATIYSSNRPVEGTISSTIWPNQVAFESEAITAEYEDKGMKMLMPYVYNGAGIIYCNEELTTAEDLSGAIVSVSSATQAIQVEALGATTTTLEFAEYYEALQRGVVDCVQSSHLGYPSGGSAEVAPHVVMDPEGPIIGGAAAAAMSMSTWEQLPLVAQQLMWDKLTTLMIAKMETNWHGFVAVVEQAEEHGGGVAPFDSSLDEPIANATAQIEQALRDQGDLVDHAKSASTYWQDSVAALELESVDDFGELDTWLTEQDFEPLREYVETTVYEEVLAPHRPE